MGKFKVLTKKETKELDELLNVADSILYTNSLVIKGNPKAATVVGNVIGGAMGAAIATSAGTVGITGTLLGTGAVGLTSKVGLVSMSIVSLPITVIGLSGVIISLLYGKNKAMKKDQQKQANYCKDLVEKMQQIFEKYEDLKKEHAQTDKEKDDIIKEQQEKIYEYEVIMEALKKKYTNLENNLGLA